MFPRSVDVLAVIFLTLLCSSVVIVHGFAPTAVTPRGVTTTSSRATALAPLHLFGLKKKDEATTKVQEEDTGVVEEDTKNDAKAQMSNMMKPIKEAGPAGALSLFLWEGAFWVLSIPVCSILYYQTTGSWPNWSDKEDVAKVTAEAFAFANIARFALPLRVGLAISTTPWVKENIVDRYGLFQGDKEE